MNNETKMPLSVMIEIAKGELRGTIGKIKSEYNLPPCIMEGILCSVLVEVQKEGKIEIINETNSIMQEKNEELERAKAAAKKVLPEEPEEIHG
ncbi:hypothetical protein [Eisenbergiella sp.]